MTSDTSLERLRDLCREHDIPFDPGWDSDQVTLEMYEHLCEDRTTMPTFYKDFPTGVSPLTRQKPSNPGWPSAGTSWLSARSSGLRTPS